MGEVKAVEFRQPVIVSCCRMVICLVPVLVIVFLTHKQRTARLVLFRWDLRRSQTGSLAHSSVLVDCIV